MKQNSPTNYRPHIKTAYWLLFVSGALCILTILTSCLFKPKTTSPYYPYENLLTIVADCRRYLRADIYRFPYPTNLSGQNAYKSALVQLANYEQLYPGRFPDIIAFMRAQLYERLGDYPQAIHYYSITAAMHSKLSPLAEERLGFATTLQSVSSFTPHTTDIDEYIHQYETKLEELDTLVQKFSGLDVEPLALIEREKAQVYFAIFLQDNRHLIADGTRRAIDAWKKVIAQNSESKNIQAHRLHLADFYFTLAKEYATLNPPEGVGFDWKVFESYATRGRDIYYQVSNEDGYPEKPEAQGKLNSILSYIESIRKRSR